jgi:ribosomal protein L32
MTDEKLVKCSICGEWMFPWHLCEDTDGCSHYYKGEDWE